MTQRRSRFRRGSLTGVVVAVVVAGCATGPRIPVNRLEELRPGVSTKADVERALGPRVGDGGAAFPADTRPPKAQYEIWYYVDWQKKSVSAQVYGLLPRMLLVFFDGDVFRGFMWFDLTGAQPASVRGPL